MSKLLRAHRDEGETISEQTEERFEVGDEVSGSYRCSQCDLLVSSPPENDGILVLPLCSLCGSESWRLA